MPLNIDDINYVLNDVRIKLPGSADSGIKQELWGVIKEFLQDSNSWIEHQTLLVTVGTQCYTVVPRDGGQFIRLIGVLDGNRLPVNATMSNLGVLEVRQRIGVSSVSVPLPITTTASNNPWCFAAVKNIKLPGTKDNMPIAPEFVLKVYSGAIIDGVLGKMMMQQAKTYTNIALGKYHLQRFRDGIGIARNDTWNQNVLGGQRWRFPPFASGSQIMGSSLSGWPVESF